MIMYIDEWLDDDYIDDIDKYWVNKRKEKNNALYHP